MRLVRFFILLSLMVASLANASPIFSGSQVNEDGSVTYTDPRFFYNGHDTAIFVSINPDFPGVCRLLGMESMVGYTTLEIEQEGFIAVALDTKGRMKAVKVRDNDFDSFYKFEIYKTVTCAK